MSHHRLPHYLRTHRRRSGLTQAELASLLGASAGTKISRYESFARFPSVVTVLAYEIIFNQPVSELFAGVYDDVLRDVRGRAAQLAETLSAGPADIQTNRKLALLRNIIDIDPKGRIRPIEP